MILSVSRRTDIPAFYSKWFFNRLKEGYVLVRNPMNYRQISRIPLNTQVIDCIVFWTKDPTKILNQLDLLAEYNYYFLITLTPYDIRLERNLPSKRELLSSFKELSKRIGKQKTIWRYDPIILTEEMDFNYHSQKFEYLAHELAGYTKSCIISFVEMYQKTKRNMRGFERVITKNEKLLKIGKRFAEIAKNHDLKLMACSETLDLNGIGIKPSKCIDDQLIADILGQEIEISKDKNQRSLCNCVTSIDIGAYNTCPHGCLYCYANFSYGAVRKNIEAHDPQSPMLIGHPQPGDRITDRKIEVYRTNQLSLF